MFIRLCICVYLAFSALPAVAERPITVFAAASLSTVLSDVITAWKGAVSVSYGGSGLLARQVALGAPADLVLLANPNWMDWLVQNDAVFPATRQDLLANVVHGEEDLAVGRLGAGRVAVAERGPEAGALLELEEAERRHELLGDAVHRLESPKDLLDALLDLCLLRPDGVVGQHLDRDVLVEGEYNIA